jgi:hypothetical protein
VTEPIQSALGLFGLYTDAKRTAIVADNVRRLWPELWLYVGDDGHACTAALDKGVHC